MAPCYFNREGKVKREVIKCDYCGEITEDFHDTIGWISIEDIGTLTISGGRAKDGCANAFRYFHPMDHVHFCGISCFLSYLYLKEGHYNSNEKTFEKKLSTIKEEPRRKTIMTLHNLVMKIIEYMT